MIIEKIERILRAPFELPTWQSKHHILLASFPKSGNTWFRFLSANLIADKLGCAPVNFYSVREFAPEIRRNRKLNGIQSHKGLPNFLKTHFYNINGFNNTRALVLYREPVKTLQSYFNYMNNEHSKNYKNLKSFVNSPRVGIDAWIYFHLTWLKSNNAIFVSYDDLVKNRMKGLKKIYNEFGYEIHEDLLERSIQFSNRKEMSIVENEFGDPYRKNKTYSFVASKENRHGTIDLEITNNIKQRSSQVYDLLEKRKLRI